MEERSSGRKTVLVAGATGRQGGAVTRELLERGHRVRALTRDPGQPAARELADLGASVVEGDLEQPRSLREAVRGADGVFSVQSFWQAGYDGEIRQGTALANAAQEAGVDHLVYSSVGGAERGTGIPHFESKWEVEEHVRHLRLPYTILRPVFFMQNWERPELRDAVRDGTIAQPLSPDVPLQQVAVEDVGFFAAEALGNPDEWVGREVEVAGDELTMEEAAEVFSRVLGREVSYVRVPWDRFEEAAGEEMALMYRWFEEEGYRADLEALREVRPELMTLERYLRSHGWERGAGGTE